MKKQYFADDLRKNATIARLKSDNTDLLAAPRAAMEFVNNSNVNTDEDHWTIWNILKAAISKARGESDRSEGLRLILDEHKYLSARFVALGRSVSDPVEGEGVA